LTQTAYNTRLGVSAALGAFTFWGLAPIFFKWIATVPPVEIIAHRIIWSIPMLAGFLLLRDGPRFWRRLRLPLRDLAVLAVSATLVGANWLLFVWAVNNAQVLATSLGYFINPLLNVVLGLLFLRERLTRIQSLAVVLAAVGTIYLTASLGVAPWISLLLALTFGLYGLVRKRLGVGPTVGLLWEALLLATPAVLFFGWGWAAGSLGFGNQGLRVDLLLVLCGLVTVLPLVWFNVAAKNMPLGAVGFFQYLSPTITFLLAVFVYGEPFTRGHAVAFACIWTALLFVTADSLWRMPRAAGP
jgi:chloramphenicol-sensitive protein RarD